MNAGAAAAAGFFLGVAVFFTASVATVATSFAFLFIFFGGGREGEEWLGCCGDDQRDRESVSVCE